MSQNQSEHFLVDDQSGKLCKMFVGTAEEAAAFLASEFADGGVSLSSEAPAASSVPPRRIGKPREFLYLFSDQEKAAFFAAKQQSADLDLWWALASTGDFSLDHPSVEPGLSLLVQQGILTEARKAEILATDFNQV